MTARRVNLGRDSSGRPLTVDSHTLAALDEAGRRLGHPLTIVQGSYVPPGTGAAASAATHAGGGVVDLRTWDIPRSVGTERAVWVLRRWCGFAAFHRKPPAFDSHIHAVRVDCTDLDPSAERQVVEWRAGGDGLVGERPDVERRPAVIRGWRALRRAARRRRFLVTHPHLAARVDDPTRRRRFLAAHPVIAGAWFALGGAR